MFIAANAQQMVAQGFSWDRVIDSFEQQLALHAPARS